MRSLQFWILLLCSCFVCFLYLRQIVLSREIDQLQRAVVDSQEAVTEGEAYENAWNQLARSVYVNGRNDPTLLAILGKEGVEVREATPTTSNVPPPISAPVPAKGAAPVHPTKP